MGTLEWRHHERIGWTDVDQDGQLKFSSIFRFVAAGYAGMFPLLTEDSRAEYFATHELQPIARHMEMARGPDGGKLDAGLSVHFTVRLGFTVDKRSGSRRYGGRDAIQLVAEHGETLGGWTQDWLWFVPKEARSFTCPLPDYASTSRKSCHPWKRRRDCRRKFRAGGFAGRLARLTSTTM